MIDAICVNAGDLAAIGSGRFCRMDEGWWWNGARGWCGCVKFATAAAAWDCDASKKLLLSKCDEITGGKVDTTDGGATGDVNTRGFAGRNLFGDKTCCGALATYKPQIRSWMKKKRRKKIHKSKVKKNFISWDEMRSVDGLMWVSYLPLFAELAFIDRSKHKNEKFA